MGTIDQRRDEASALQDDLVALRRAIHRHPEIGLQLPRTQEAVLNALDGLDLEVSTGRALSSVTAVLRGARPGPAVLLRADMDALAITEATGLDYASEVAGVMHACGHDLHVAMLVGAARLLSAHRDALDGDVVFMFQPGEEGYNGAGHMIAEGVLDAAGVRVSSAYGMHVRSHQNQRGTFSSRPGPLMAAVDGLSVTVHGVGGHGSMPHKGRDPVTTAAEMVIALQTLVTRRFDAFDPVVITVGSFHAGTSASTIPETARFEATVRAFSSANQALIRSETARLCENIASAYGSTAEVEYCEIYPVTVNNAEQYAFAGDVISDVLGPERFQSVANPIGSAEDFSRVLDEVPGCYVLLGASAADDPLRAASNHSPRAIFDDAVLSDGALVYAELAIRALHRDASRRLTGDK